MMTNLITQLNNDLSTIVETVRGSLVSVKNGRGAGAGTIWHSDGLILTNAHVVRRRQVTVTLPDGREFPTKLLAYDEGRDLAALSINASNLPTIALGDSEALQAGQWVVAVGHPWGVHGAATAGAVIATGRPPELSLKGEFVQVGLPLRPGHSGGPLVDVFGRLVGINTMITGPSVGLAVPVHVVKAFLKETLGTADTSPEVRRA